MASVATIGLVVNPVAGMGGRVGLKGTDGPETLARALGLGATPVAPERARRVLGALTPSAGRLRLITYPGSMGAAAAQAAGIEATVVGRIGSSGTTHRDTRRAARDFLKYGVELILFVGGDGTARDIHDVVQQKIPILGVPSGVKMQSAVFATNPEGAGRLLALYVEGGRDAIRSREAEVMDIDEEAVRQNRLSARLYGYALVPFERTLVQGAKSAGAASEDIQLDAACRQIAAEMDPDCLYIIGPGSTTRRVMQHLGLEGTLLGIDAILNRALAGTDLNEAQIAELLRGRPARIIVGVVGGQGFIFGRGNQPISADIIRKVGLENIIVVSTPHKLVSLFTGCLLVDTGDREIDRMLAGYVRVLTGPGQSMMLRVSAASD